jgi:hypothetical protein
MIITRAFVGAMMLNFAVKLSDVDPRYEGTSADTIIEELVSLFLDGLSRSDEA